MSIVYMPMHIHRCIYTQNTCKRRDGKWTPSDLAGQPVVVLVSVHGQKDVLVGKVAVPMGSTLVSNMITKHIS